MRESRLASSFMVISSQISSHLSASSPSASALSFTHVVSTWCTSSIESRKKACVFDYYWCSLKVESRISVGL